MLILRDISNQNLKTTCLVRYSRTSKGLPQLEFLFQQIQLPAGRKINDSSRILWLNQLGVISKYLKSIEKLYLSGQLNDIIRVHLFSSEILNYEEYIASIYNNENIDLLNLINQTVSVENYNTPRFDIIEILINPNNGTFSLSKIFAYKNVQQNMNQFTPFVGLETAFVVQNIQIVPNLSAFIDFLSEYKTVMTLSGISVFNNSNQTQNYYSNRVGRNSNTNTQSFVNGNTQMNQVPNNVNSNTTSVNPMFLDNNNY